MLFLVADHLWQSTFFVAGVALLTRLIRPNGAKLRYTLWLAASLKFLVPFAFLTALGAHVTWRSVPTAPAPLIVLMDRLAEPLGLRDLTMREAVSSLAWASEAILLRILAVIWVCGVLAVFVSWLKRWRRVQAALDESTPTDILFPVPVRSSRTLLEPGVVGFLRPVLLVPNGIKARLSAEQLRAVLAHEFCHVRRRDNLTATCHMAVEALFWFYPLVWWLGSRLIEERERACDEEVLRAGHNPAAYAEGILRVCQHYLESPLICAAGVSGANLTRRIEEIMKNQSSTRLNTAKKLILAAAATAAVAVPLIAGLATAPVVRAQSSTTAGASAELRKKPPSSAQSSLGDRFAAVLKESYPQLGQKSANGTQVLNILFGEGGKVDRSGIEVFSGPPEDFKITKEYYSQRFGIPANEVAYVGLQGMEFPSGERFLVAFTERKTTGPFVSSVIHAPDTRAIDRAMVERYFPEALKQGAAAQARLWVLLDSEGRVLRTGQESAGEPQIDHVLKGRFPGIETESVTVTPVTNANLQPVNDLSGKPLQLNCVWLKKGSPLPGGNI
ncbi:MAG TPA: M56 family metallopeptidase [Steroidobacteraceae bacterium]|jgi:beta-lactamase regulating signal transducer with metallopeptidase domain